MNKSQLKGIIKQLGLSQAGFARAIGMDSALLRKQLMDDIHKAARPVSPNTESEALSLLAHHRGQLPEWTIGIDAEDEMEVTTIHHNIYPRFTAFITEGLPSGVSMDAWNDVESISIIWHSQTGRMELEDIKDWMNRAMAAEQMYNITLDDD